MTSWIILRTAGHTTLRLAASLAEAGFETWTPVETVTLRARRGHKREEVPSPLMPGYAFAQAERKMELLALSHSPALIYQIWDSSQRRMVTKGYPHFTLFRPLGGHDEVPEAQLANLRRLDGLRRPKGPLRQWEQGDRIRLTDGAYAGLSGEVLRWFGEQTTIAIDGWALQPTVSTRLLHPELDEPASVQLSVRSSEQALSAKAA